MTRPPIRTSAVLLAVIVCSGAISVGASAVGAVPAAAGVDAATFTDQHAEPEGDAGDARDDATEVSAGETVDGTADGEDSDTDWYALDVEAGDYLRITHVGSSDQSIEIYGPNGTKLGEDEMYATEALAVGAPVTESGTYYVRTRLPSGYSYSITFDVASPDDFEPNDQRSEAAAVESDAELGAVVGEDETDWYAVDLSAGETLHATLDRGSGLACGNDLAVDVFDEEGDRISQVDADRGGESNRTFHCVMGSPPHTAIQRATADQSGTYYVRVTGVNVEGFHRYDLSLSVEREAPPPVVGDAPPTDPDGDGRYEDVNGNERLDFDDVVALFANIQDDAVTNHVDAYDFNENGRVDFGDVVALFAELIA